MKRCPTCQRTYTDDSLTFCLEDGGLLITEQSTTSPNDTAATMILNEPPPTSSRTAAPTEIYNATPTQGGTSAPGYTAPPSQPVWTPSPAQQAQPFGQQSWAAAANAVPPNKLVLGLLGGAIGAVPSLIPLIQWGCCLWAAAGGLLAAALYIKKSPTKVEMGEGAMIGAIAGGVGGLINLIVGVPIAYALYGPRGPYGSADGAIGVGILFGLLGTLALVGFAIAGGLLAVQMFEKRTSGAGAPQPPPPPPTYGGGYR